MSKYEDYMLPVVKELSKTKCSETSILYHEYVMNLATTVNCESSYVEEFCSVAFLTYKHNYLKALLESNFEMKDQHAI
jgi:hypothetical protein